MDKPRERTGRTNPKSLKKIFDVGSADDERLWQDDELAAIFRHQMAATIGCDLSGLRPGAADKIRTLAEAQGLLLKSLSDLLYHPSPPIDLLKMTKQFAKRIMASADESIFPRDIAAVLYYASTAAARLRCKRSISTLTPTELRIGLDWCLARPWLDESICKLLRECRQSMDAA